MRERQGRDEGEVETTYKEIIKSDVPFRVRKREKKLRYLREHNLTRACAHRKHVLHILVRH